jgi:UDP-N-acetylenolpyruvoylglucosamine reductase
MKKGYLTKLIAKLLREELQRISEEDFDYDYKESPQDAYEGGSDFAASGKYINYKDPEKAKEAYEKDKCLNHYKQWGRILPAMSHCEKILRVSGGGSNRNISKQSSSRLDIIDKRLDDIERRLQDAGIE